MKSFRKVAIAAMLAVAPVMAVGTAWANTELVPGSRLVAPYWDVSGDRSTLVFITNASTKANLVAGTSAADLKGTCNLGAALPGTNCFVHLEFYDKTCVNIDYPMDLSKTDIDQFDLNTDGDLSGVRSLPSQLGWLDVDVRKALQGSGHTNTGVQANVLMGTVVISDSGSDFAVAYPMAASQGSANSGIGGDIVTRNDQGNALAWTGGYESFPARVFVPMFFAEGSNHGVTFTSTLAIAGPAQAIAGGEAPGQDLHDDVTTPSLDEGILINAAVDIYDACERGVSDSLTGHYIIGTLDELFIQQVTAPYLTANCGTAYPVADIDRKPGQAGGNATDAFIGGWIDIRNGLAVDTELNLPRGLVGVLVQNTASRGDATRLWGDCSYGPTSDGGTYIDANSGGVLNGTPGCRPSFSLVNGVNHHDIHPF